VFDSSLAILHYKMNFNLIKSNLINISLTELDDMLPFEREIYINLYIEELERVNAER